MISLAGKVAFITGATRGIGQAIAVALGKQGAIVIGTATSQAGADKISATLKAEGISGRGYVLNVCEPDTIKDIFKEVTAEYGAPLILVNNAAITQDNLGLIGLNLGRFYSNNFYDGQCDFDFTGSPNANATATANVSVY